MPTIDFEALPVPPMDFKALLVPPMDSKAPPTPMDSEMALKPKESVDSVQSEAFDGNLFDLTPPSSLQREDSVMRTYNNIGHIVHNYTMGQSYYKIYEIGSFVGPNP